jgi:hypothetical protein
LAEAPAEWNNGVLPKIHQHLETVAGNAGEFTEEIKKRLA